MRTQQTRTKNGTSTGKKDDKIIKAFKNLESLIHNGKVSGKPIPKRKTTKPKKTVADSKKRKRDVMEKEQANEGEVVKGDEKTRKKRRLKPGTKALREIKKQQKTAQDKNAIAKKSFENLVRDVIGEITPEGTKYRIGKEALKILQEVSEGYLVQCLSLGHTLDIELGKRSSITKKGLKTANTLLTKQHLLNNSVRGTDLLGEFTEAFPKAQEGKTKKRVYKKKKDTNKKAKDEVDGATAVAEGDTEREPSIEVTAQKGGDEEELVEAAPREEAVTSK